MGSYVGLQANRDISRRIVRQWRFWKQQSWRHYAGCC